MGSIPVGGAITRRFTFHTTILPSANCLHEWDFQRIAAKSSAAMNKKTEVQDLPRLFYHILYKITI